MKKQMLSLSVAVCAFVIMSASWAMAQGGTTATVPRVVRFSGVLTDLAGKPLTGPLDVTFSLYRELAGGEPLWFETQRVEADAQGRYTVLLGAMHEAGLPVEVFASGGAHWMGVAVGNLPEQSRALLVSVPYALKAADAETLGGKPASAFQLTETTHQTASSNLTTVVLPMSASTNVSGRRNSTSMPQDATIAGGTGTTNKITKWLNSTGTLTDSAVFESNGLVGIGTTTPGVPLAVESSDPFAGLVVGQNSGVNPKQLLFGFDTTNNFASFQAVQQGVAYMPLVLQKNGGYVGIGTTTPTAKLGVETTDPFAGFSIGQNTPPNPKQLILGYDTVNNFGSIVSLQQGVGYTPLALQKNGGNVGIGTTTPGQTLDVSGNINASGNLTLGGNINPSGNLTLGGNISTSGSVQATLSGSTTGTVALFNFNNGGAGPGARILSGQWQGVENFSVAPSGNLVSTTVTANGGTFSTAGISSTSSLLLTPAGNFSNTSGGVAVQGAVSGSTTGTVALFNFNNGSSGGGSRILSGQWQGVENFSVTPSGNLVSVNVTAGSGTFSPNGIRSTSSNLFPPAGVFNNTGGGNILVGQASGVNEFRVDNTGKGFFNGGTQTGGADFAESVAVLKDRSHYQPGDVLVIDRSGNRRLALAQEPYSTLVAGIYSTKPGVLATPHTMDDQALNHEVPLAIVGIVPCKVSAEHAAIHRGDLLVTSSIPGYAMKGMDRSRMLGAVLGKALEPLENGRGVIEVLVTLQ